MKKVFICICLILGGGLVGLQWTQNIRCMRHLQEISLAIGARQIDRVSVFDSGITAIFPSKFQLPSEYGVKTEGVCSLAVLQRETDQPMSGEHKHAALKLSEVKIRIDSASMAWSRRMTGAITDAVYLFQKDSNRIFAFYMSPEGRDGAMATWRRHNNSWIIEEEYITAPNALYEYLSKNLVERCSSGPR